MGTWIDIPEDKARPGDWALHRGGNLDPREVSATSASGGRNQIWLRLLTEEAGPFPRANYTYRRYKESSQERALRLSDWRKRVLALPWVRRETKDVRCDAIRWSQMSLKATHEYRETGEVPDRARCKHRAEFRLTSVARARQWEVPAEKGSYCPQHLGMQLSDPEPERRRYDRWLEKQEGTL